jgi:AcrR family transcriptional regulator
VRADAVRNMDALMQTGARLLARDPATSMATIAAEAGVDRRTVYRRFATREALLVALFTAKLDAFERVLDEARLEEAPVAVALHRYVEAILPVSRQWPVDFGRLESGDDATEQRRQQLRDRLDVFFDRATAEGLFRADLPPGWARRTTQEFIHVGAHRYPDLDPPRLADLIVDCVLNGLGRKT